MKTNVGLWCFRFIFFVSSLLFCTDFNISKNFDVIRYPFVRVYCVTVFALVSLYYCLRYESSHKFFHDSTQQMTLIYFEFNLYWFVSVTTFLLNIANQNRVAKWYATMLDKMLRVERSGFETVAVILLLCYVLDLSILAVYVPLSFSARSQPDDSAKAYIVYYTLCGMSLMTVLQIATGISFLAFIFNDLVLEFSETFSGFVQDGWNEEKVRDITRKYQVYYSLALDFNRYFSTQILLLSLLMFTELTYSTYYIIQLLYSSKENLFLKSDTKLPFSLSFFAFYIVQLIEYAGLGQILADKITELNYLTNSAYSRVTGELEETLEIFVIQRATLNFELTAANFFKVDNGLIFKIVSLVSSTTVILLQFDGVFVQNSYNNLTISA